MTAAWIAAAASPALDAALALDPDARARVARLDGAVLAIYVTGADCTLYLLPEGDRLRLRADSAEPPTASISGPPASLATLAATAGTRVLFAGSLRVDGDITVAKAYKRLFDTLDPDWEEAVAGALGDVPAHELGRLARGLRAWAARAAAGRRDDLRAWLVDEVETVPARHELDAWLAGVDRMRADVDRLAARLARLERLRADRGEG